MEMVEIELAMTDCRRGFGQPCVVVGLNRDTETVRIVPLPPSWSPEKFVKSFNRGMVSYGGADAYKFPEVDDLVQTVTVCPDSLTEYTGPG